MDRIYSRQELTGGMGAVGASPDCDTRIGGYGSFALREKQLQIELERAQLSVREAMLSVERHDEQDGQDKQVLQEGLKADVTRASNYWSAARRDELMLEVDHRRLHVRAVEIAIRRHQAEHAAMMNKANSVRAGRVAPADAFKDSDYETKMRAVDDSSPTAPGN